MKTYLMRDETWNKVEFSESMEMGNCIEIDVKKSGLMLSRGALLQ